MLDKEKRGGTRAVFCERTRPRIKNMSSLLSPVSDFCNSHSKTRENDFSPAVRRRAAELIY